MRSALFACFLFHALPPPTTCTHYASKPPDHSLTNGSMKSIPPIAPVRSAGRTHHPPAHTKQSEREHHEPRTTHNHHCSRDEAWLHGSAQRSELSTRRGRASGRASRRDAVR
ncbi:hypothetical protein IWX46DRAFT_457965 [Phyllosticta citricarpa]|uniref:Secreted protein n=1 Tax=Phyllosticta citricarpa TaxID=55181 RepID=A0ABR1MIG9_9PEZI